MSTSAISSASSTSSGSATSTSGDSLQNVSMDDFLKLLLTELQNQDPTNPVNDSEILNQVSQIKAIESNQRLTDTLTTMQSQQELVAASSLLQKTVTGLDDSGNSVSGKVDKVTVDSSGTKVCIGDNSISLKNITEVDPTT